MVVLWERNFHVFEISSSHTNDLIFKAWTDGVASEFKGITLSLSTFKRHTVNGTVEIDHYDITGYRRAFIDYSKLSMTLLQTLELFVQFLFRNFSGYSSYFNTFVITQFNFRFHRYSSFELESFTFSELLDVHFRTIYRENIRLIYSFAVCFWKQDVDCILVQALYAITSFKNRARHFTFTESRYICFF
eukprot:TRINITY_DN1322_c0_g2_i1.p1 TRINITY_DN1322_c0_g2~~TRINITY_DN1322_c0_g2_i1.p1  ORF type:complete len:189 (-),score=12.87 TRINITY_DN1322_c0_g2_i1:145-711(-)